MSRKSLANLSVGGGLAAVSLAVWASCGGSGNATRPSETGSSSSSSGGAPDATAGGSSSGSSSGAGSSSSGSSSGGGLCGQPSTAVANPIIYNGASCSTMIPAPRSGYWFKYNEMNDAGNATAFSAAAGGCDGPMDCAIHVTGSGFVEYAGAGFNFNGGNGTNTAYDASAYRGIEFWAKGTITGSRAGNNTTGFNPANQNIFVEFLGADQRPSGDEYGAYCVLNSDGVTWTHCTVDFATATRLGFADPPETGPDMFDKTNLYKLQFQFSPFMGSPEAVAETVGFDIWIDDVYFH